MPEQQNIEYRQSLQDEYLKGLCGFANAFGGIEVPFSPKIINHEEANQTGSKIGGEIGSQDGGHDGVLSALTERQKDVFKLLVANPIISRKQLAEIGAIERASETTGHMEYTYR